MIDLNTIDFQIMSTTPRVVWVGSRGNTKLRLVARLDESLDNDLVLVGEEERTDALGKPTWVDLSDPWSSVLEEAVLSMAVELGRIPRAEPLHRALISLKRDGRPIPCEFKNLPPEGFIRGHRVTVGRVLVEEVEYPEPRPFGEGSSFHVGEEITVEGGPEEAIDETPETSQKEPIEPFDSYKAGRRRGIESGSIVPPDGLSAVDLIRWRTGYKHGKEDRDRGLDGGHIRFSRTSNGEVDGFDTPQTLVEALVLISATVDGVETRPAPEAGAILLQAGTVVSVRDGSPFPVLYADEEPILRLDGGTK